MKMKKITALALCITIFLMHSIVSFAAEDEQLPPTGLIWDTWESYMENMDETTLRALTTQRMGDVDADGRITASDACLCLRAAADLETLTEPQRIAADVNNNWDITSSDARKVLRAAAGLDILEDMSVETSIDWGFVVGPLKNAGSGRYYWQCSVDKNELTVNEYTVDTASEKDGAPVEQFFAFTPKAEGTYTINFKLADSTQNDIIDEFVLNVTVQ